MPQAPPPARADASAPEEGIGIAVDNAGNAYVTGYTGSPSFPTLNPLQPTHSAAGEMQLDAFVTKLSADGSTLLYSTFFGGAGGDERGLKIAVDQHGNAYIAGMTSSTSLPTTAGAYQPVFAGGERDAFVAKLDATGSALVYSSYLGGSLDEGVVGQVSFGIAVDAEGNAYVRGNTNSLDFPTTPGAFQTTYAGGFRDAFVTKVNPTGTALVYSTFLGGSGEDRCQGMAIDADGNAYLTGFTDSNNFPTLTPFQAGRAGGQDAFVTKLNPDGTNLVYSSYLGGTGLDQGWGGAVDAAGNFYLAGRTISTDFPTVNAFQPTYGGGTRDILIVKVNPAGSGLVYSTYLGGSANDVGSEIAIDSQGNAYLTGSTSSLDFPTANAIQLSFGGGDVRSNSDAVIAKLNPSGSALVYSTYLGGSSDDAGLALAVDSAGNAYVTGWTHAIDFPTANAFQPTDGGTIGTGPLRLSDAIVVKIGDLQPPAVTCSVAVSLLWPPNHQLVNVGLGVSVTDDSDPSPTVQVLVYGNGGADPSNVASIGPSTLHLGAERQGNGNGRVYIIVVTATDMAGNVAFDVCTVVVPHSRSPAAIAAAQAQAAAAAAFYRAFQTAPPGYSLLGEGPIP